MNERDSTLLFSTKARPWLFLGLTLGITWMFQLVAISLQGELPRWVVFGVAYFGGLSPLLVALALLFWGHDRTFRRDFWRRLVDVRRIRAVWFLVIFFLQPALALLAALLAILGGGAGIAPEMITQLARQPLLIVPLMLWWLLFGPLVEEPGWRGYALDGLQARYRALASSLIIGALRTVWHLPLFWLAGTWQAQNVGVGTTRFWLYMANIVLIAIVYTWIYNNTERSILAMVLFHFSVNSFGELFALSPQAEMVYTLLLGTTALLIVVTYSSEAWTRNTKPSRSTFSTTLPRG